MEGGLGLTKTLTIKPSHPTYERRSNKTLTSNGVKNEETKEKKMKKAKPNPQFLLIPNEVYMEIVSFLECPKDFFAFIGSCKSIYNYYNTENLYNSVDNNVLFQGCKMPKGILCYVHLVGFAPRRIVFRDWGVVSKPINVDDKLLVDVKRKFPNLRYISLYGCKQLTDNGLSYLSGIEAIILNDCNKITDKGLSYLSKVKKINLTGCTKITNQGLKYLEEVKEIWFGNSEGITDEGLSYLKEVEVITFLNCKHITDQGFKHLIKVKEIELGWCDQITIKGLMHLKGVEEITLRYYGSEHITNEELKHLKDVKIYRVGTVYMNGLIISTSIVKHMFINPYKQ